MLGIQGVYCAASFDQVAQVAQSSQDLSNWQPKAANLTPPDTFCTRKEAVSFGNSYGRKLKCDEKIAAIENAKGDEKGDMGDYCICLSSDDIGDNKIVTNGFEAAEESLKGLMVQQSVMEDNFKMKEEIRKYKELCNKQKYEIAEQKKRLDSNLLQISQQLIVLQKSLQRKEKTFSKTLRRKDKTIRRQQELINDLLEKNVDIGGENIVHEDSDSGVVFSEAEFGQHKVNRSVSGVRNTGGWGGHSFLGKEDSINTEKKIATFERKTVPCDSKTPSSNLNKLSSNINNDHRDLITDPSDLNTVPSDLTGAPSDLTGAPSDPSKRVFLNHRSVTRLKDIKYKRISKTKSKSMEELRDKLRDSPFLGQDSPRYSHA